MNEIYLPNLLSINIKEYSLYNQDIKYDFVYGVNLIIGGNGNGKTTFLNLIKYGLIGLYQKELDVRTYLGEKRLSRKSYSKDFFKNRMKSSSPNAEIELKFKINETIFNVKRGLEELILKEVIIEESGHSYKLEGNIIRQDKYERIENSLKKNYLQFKYEELVAEKANLNSFDDLIFFVNDILFFGEDRKTILWDENVQSILSSKYFNDPKLDSQFQEYKRQEKYYNSLSRHKSEDIRAIRKILDKLEVTKGNNKELVAINELNRIKQKNEKVNGKLNSIQIERSKVENDLKILSAKRVNYDKNIKELENKIKEFEKDIYLNVWEELNPKYNIYLNSLKLNHICPMCSNSIEEKEMLKLLDNSSCFLCNHEISVKENIDNIQVNELKKELNSFLKEKQEAEITIYNQENELKNLDLEYEKLKKDLFNNQIKIRKLEHDTVNNQNINDESNAYNAMILEIEELEKLKNEYSFLSKDNGEKANEILNAIENNLVKITRELSSIFSVYSGDFLGLNSKLTLDNFNNKQVKMYLPVIDDKLRAEPEELSESQRFFIDHAFRMSLLNFFYTTPTYFICETPDSSLDISYEENAAKIFLRFLESKNTLIISSNLNNSEFLENIVEKSSNISAINLLKVGNPSDIQHKNNKLLDLSIQIEEKINERKRTNFNG